MSSGLNVEPLKLFAMEQRLAEILFFTWYEFVPTSQPELKVTLRRIAREKDAYGKILSGRLQVYGDTAEIPGRAAHHKRELARRLDALRKNSQDRPGLFELVCNRQITSAPTVDELLDHVGQVDPVLVKILELIKLQDEQDVIQLRILCGVD